jgi:hypothetical protein
VRFFISKHEKLGDGPVAVTYHDILENARWNTDNPDEHPWLIIYSLESLESVENLFDPEVIKAIGGMKYIHEQRQGSILRSGTRMMGIFIARDEPILLGGIKHV